MIEKYYEALQKRENLRENLVGLRAQIKDEAAKEQFVSMIGDGGLLLELLEEEDPKVRKNVAMILGELECILQWQELLTEKDILKLDYTMKKLHGKKLSTLLNSQNFLAKLLQTAQRRTLRCV